VETGTEVGRRPKTFSMPDGNFIYFRHLLWHYCRDNLEIQPRIVAKWQFGKGNLQFGKLARVEWQIGKSSGKCPICAAIVYWQTGKMAVAKW
jgi:hypothetical protein